MAATRSGARFDGDTLREALRAQFAGAFAASVEVPSGASAVTRTAALTRRPAS
jgi:hypothetical protein